MYLFVYMFDNVKIVSYTKIGMHAYPMDIAIHNLTGRCFMEDYTLYTVKEIRDILKVTQRTLYNYIKSGNLKAVKIGKYWRIRKEDLEEFLMNGTNLKKD